MTMFTETGFPETEIDDESFHLYQSQFNEFATCACDGRNMRMTQTGDDLHQ